MRPCRATSSPCLRFVEPRLVGDQIAPGMPANTVILVTLAAVGAEKGFCGAFFLSWGALSAPLPPSAEALRRRRMAGRGRGWGVAPHIRSQHFCGCTPHPRPLPATRDARGREGSDRAVASSLGSARPPREQAGLYFPPVRVVFQALAGFGRGQPRPLGFAVLGERALASHGQEF